MEQGIDHHIADHEDAAPGPAFFQKVLDGVLFGNEQIVGESVGEDAVDLLGHAAVVGAQPGLHVPHPDPELVGGQGGAQQERGQIVACVGDVRWSRQVDTH